MIRSLEDAWRWYEAVSDLVGMMDRVARRYLSEELGKQTLEETLHRDDKITDPRPQFEISQSALQKISMTWRFYCCSQSSKPL